MKELQNILQLYEKTKKANRFACLATVVQTQGSTYRRPGARMLITEDGQASGTISGGCLENDLVKKATDVIHSGEPLLLTYDSTSPADIVWGFGLGCAGVVHVLLERVPKRNGAHPLDFMSESFHNHREGVVATVYRVTGTVEARVGTHVMLREDGTFDTDIAARNLVSPIRDDCTKQLKGERLVVSSYNMPGGSVEAFIEVIRFPLSLVVFGAGADAVPLVQCAKELGWCVTLVDNRAPFLQRDRFPRVDNLVLCDLDEVKERVPVSGDDVVVIMMHNYNSELQLLKALLPSPVCYIGLLGPQSKARTLLQDLQSHGLTPTDKQLSRLYSPIGLDIGAETPEEIALAVVAEIQAVITGRAGGSLRVKGGPIHDITPLPASRV